MNKASERRTQAERRAESRQAVLHSACKLFGQQGYAATSLEQIAADCGLTIRPIYHYFINKKGLFAAVNEVMEQRILESNAADLSLASDKVPAQPEPLTQSIPPNSSERDEKIELMLMRWARYLDLCEDAGFRRIVLIDSPAILGRDRWADSAVTRQAAFAIAGLGSDEIELHLLNRILMAAFTEAALGVAEADNFELARQHAEKFMRRVTVALSSHDQTL